MQEVFELIKLTAPAISNILIPQCDALRTRLSRLSRTRPQHLRILPDWVQWQDGSQRFQAPSRAAYTQTIESRDMDPSEAL